MSRNRIRLALALGFAVFSQSALSPLPAEPKDDKSQQQKDKEKADKKSVQQARKYEELRAFAEDLYAKDSTFKDRVDEHFASVQQGHSMEAFDRNIRPPARYTIAHDGDRLRLQRGLLYDNKLVSDYINRVGQSMVPEDSQRLYAFRLVEDPNPFAETLSTGTIYISTGLLSLLDNEAQLAYVLSHEMAHVHHDHWRLKSMLELGDEEYQKKQATKRAIWTAIAAGAGAGLGAAIGGSNNIALGAVAGGAAGFIVSSIVFRGMNLDWDKVQEDQADKLAFDMALKRKYNVRQVPKMYLTLHESVRRDPKVGLGFMGNTKRVQQRLDKVNEFINTTYKADIDKATLVDSRPEYAMVMSELKRDNGILAFYHDMFYLAKANLEFALEVRDNDPATHYYYAKVLRLVGRSADDSRLADQHFATAINLDKRNRFPAAHYYRALNLMDLSRPAGDNPNKARVVEYMQGYLNAHLGFASEEAALYSFLPANLDDIYDYMSQAGEFTFRPKLPENLLANWSSQLPPLLSTPPQAPASTAPAIVPAAAPPEPAAAPPAEPARQPGSALRKVGAPAVAPARQPAPVKR